MLDQEACAQGPIPTSASVSIGIIRMAVGHELATITLAVKRGLFPASDGFTRLDVNRGAQHEDCEENQRAQSFDGGHGMLLRVVWLLLPARSRRTAGGGGKESDRRFSL